MPKKPTTVKNAKPREAILAAAAKLFSEYGYAGTTMRDVGTAVGILPGSLYAHFESKEEMLLEVVKSGINKFLELESRISQLSGTPEEQLRAAIKFHIEMVAESPRDTQVISHQWRFLSGANRKRVAALRNRYASLFREILARGIADGTFNSQLDQSVEVLALLGALNWIPEWYSPKGPYHPSEIAEKMTDMLLHGLCQIPSNKI